MLIYKKINSLFLSLCAALFLITPVFAIQTDTETEDVVYLKDGTVLHGEIIERNGDTSLRIETACRNIYVVWLDEVEEIREEPRPVPQFYRRKGYVNQTGLEILPGKGPTSVRFQMVHGYQFHPLFSAGLGFGFSTYNDPLGLVPFFLEFRLKLAEANTASFIFLKTGYNISSHNDERVPVENHSGGMMINPGIGLQFDTSSGFGLYFHAGYNIDEASFEQDGGGGQIIITELAYKRIHFGFGLSF
jgi:hypothetical protein